MSGPAGPIAPEVSDGRRQAGPRRLPRLTPYLIIDGADAAIDFYGRCSARPSGCAWTGPATARSGTPSSSSATPLIMLADEFPDMDIRGPKSLGGTPMTHQPLRGRRRRDVRPGHGRRAPRRAAGQNQFYGDRAGQFEDPFGHRWSVATHVEDVRPRRWPAVWLKAMAESGPEGG